MKCINMAHTMEPPIREDIRMLTEALRMLPQVVKQQGQTLTWSDPQGREMTMSCQPVIVVMPGRPGAKPTKGKPKRLK